VDVVDDDGNPRASSGKPSENSRLAAMGMHNLRFVLTQHHLQIVEGKEILQRMNRTNQFRNHGQQTRRRLNGRFERSFRTRVGPEMSLTSTPGF